MRRILPFALVAVGACAAPSRAPGSSAGEPALPIWTADDRGEPLALPQVVAEVAGNAVALIVDTGASQHFVADAVAWEHAIPAEDLGAEGTDSFGGRLRVRRAPDGTLRLPGWRPEATPHLFVVDSDNLALASFAGGLAPQLLGSDDDAVVVDLRAGQLAVAPEGSLEGSEREPAGRICPSGDDPNDGWHYILPVSVEGRTVELLVDTGADGTVVNADSEVGPLLEARVLQREALEAVDDVLRPPDETGETDEPTRTLLRGGTTIVEVFRVQGVQVEVGGAGWSHAVVLQPGSRGGRCGAEGVLGFDVLRHCRLVLHRAGMSLRCDESEPVRRRLPRGHRPRPVVLEAIETEPACGLTASDLAPEVTGAGLPLHYDSALVAYGALHAPIEQHVRYVEDRCRGEGYLDARVRRPVLLRRGDRLRIAFAVEAGDRYRVRSFRITVSRAGEAPQELESQELPWASTRPGRPYRQEDLARDVRALGRLLRDEGYEMGATVFEVGEVPDAAEVELRLQVEALPSE